MAPLQFSVGDVRIDAVADLPVFEMTLASLLPDATAEALAPDLPWLEPDHLDLAQGLTRLACHAFLLRAAGRTILVDTCVGCGKSRPARPDWHLRTDERFLAGLRACGVAPGQVDVVFCTHLHADHTGWNTYRRDGRWVPTFPRARYLVGRREVEHWEAARAGNPAVLQGAWEDSVAPLIEAGQLDRVEDGYELADGIELRPLSGHTPGQMGLFLASGGDCALFCGDAIHSPAQIVHPGWSTSFCIDPAAAGQTRAAILESLSANGGLLVPAHFRGPGRARIQGGGSGFTPLFP